MEQWSCDRNICFKNEFNGVECKDCEITKHNEQVERLKESCPCGREEDYADDE